LSESASFTRSFWRIFATHTLLLSIGIGLAWWGIGESAGVELTRRGMAISGVVALVVAFVTGLLVRVEIWGKIEKSRRQIQETLSKTEDVDISGDLTETVAEWRRKVELIEADKARLSVLLGAMSEAVVMLDENERILIANPVAEKVLELTKNYVGKRLVETTRLKRLADIVSDVLWREGATITEVDWSVESNDVKHFWVSVAPIISDDDIPEGVVIVMYDVTRLRRLERVRRDFVANVSHELRTPIATIQSSAETLLMDGMDVGPVGKDFVETIFRQSGRMAQIVEDLLTLSRLEAAGEELLMEKVALAPIFADILERFESVAEKRGVDLKLEAGDELPLVEAEPRALKQILSNLVENGLKYTPSGGHVVIRATSTDKEVRVEVEDSGVGISPEHVHRVFERFYRVDTGRSREVGGTGLGLAIAKHLVRRMGGDIVLHSQPDRGSVFRFWLRVPQGDS